MATKIMTFRGTANWARIFPENREMMEWDEDTGSYTKPSTVGGVYQMDLIMSPEDYRELKMSGSLAAKHSRLDEAGNDVVRFKRQHEKRGKEGKLLEFASGAPEVINAATGEAWDFEKDGPIGNGSEVEVTVAVYTTRFSPGTRLEKVAIINHVPVPEREEEAA